MTQFWMISAALLLVALAFAVVPLWRSTVRNNEVVRDAANLEIFRDQIAEMEADLANGLLTAELYEQGKRELQARVLDEVKSVESTDSMVRDPHRKLAIALTLLIPLLAVGIYRVVGTEEAFLPQVSNVAGDNGFGAVRSEAALENLQKKLATEPNNPDAWLVLARSMMEQEKFAEAVQAFKKLVELVPDAAPVWADYADAQAMLNGQSLKGAPTEMLNKALAIEPDNAKALALSGSAAMERGDYAAAIRHWERLRKQTTPDSDEARMLDEGIAQAREFQTLSKGGKIAEPAKLVGGKERISGVVVLADSMRTQVTPEDVVFVAAFAVSGPRMPLAVMRRQVKDLPLEFVMDDSMAMVPEARMSKFDQIAVVARVSKSGNAKLQPGDIQGFSEPLKPGSQGVRVVIDSIVHQGQ